MRAVVYIRCGSRDAMDALDAIDKQMGICSAYAEEHGLEIVDVCTDLGVSGRESTKERPGYRELISLIDEGNIEGVLVTDIARLSRDWLNSTTIERELKEKGIEIITTTGRYAT
jgi:DNA invertase Pin-like site-specific DNA recombinase